MSKKERERERRGTTGEKGEEDGARRARESGTGGARRQCAQSGGGVDDGTFFSASISATRSNAARNHKRERRLSGNLGSYR